MLSDVDASVCALQVVQMVVNVGGVVDDGDRLHLGVGAQRRVAPQPERVADGGAGDGQRVRAVLELGEDALIRRQLGRGQRQVALRARRLKLGQDAAGRQGLQTIEVVL
jgi:hypothetical protein